jgi:hypothetical protein
MEARPFCHVCLRKGCAKHRVGRPTKARTIKEYRWNVRVCGYDGRNDRAIHGTDSETYARRQVRQMNDDAPEGLLYYAVKARDM